MSASFFDLLENFSPAQWQPVLQNEQEQALGAFLQSRPEPGVDTFAKLISPAAAPHLEAMARHASAITAERHGKVIRFYAPVYISNECTNTCTYCGFTMENKINRKTLNLGEMRAEAEHLHRRGFRQILLVSGEHQRIVTPEFVASMVEPCKDLFSSISIETAPFQTKDYATLVQGGVDGLTLYQETYDREVYKQVHVRGKKRDFDFRLEAPARAAEGRMRRLNMGVLLGLAPDWRLDSLKCALHIDWMMKHHWRVQYSVSLPRLCSSETDFQPAVEINDRQFVQTMCAWRIAFPDIAINVSTREPAALRDGIIGLGVTHMSAESATEPGGYCNPDEALKQFDITDHRRLQDIISAIRSRGYDIAWKDWEECMLG